MGAAGHTARVRKHNERWSSAHVLLFTYFRIPPVGAPPLVRYPPTSPDPGLNLPLRQCRVHQLGGSRCCQAGSINHHCTWCLLKKDLATKKGLLKPPVAKGEPPPPLLINLPLGVVLNIYPRYRFGRRVAEQYWRSYVCEYANKVKSQLHRAKAKGQEGAIQLCGEVPLHMATDSADFCQLVFMGYRELPGTQG